MRIEKVYIENYKNLKQFSIDLDENEMKTVLLGQNATGKSNFMEVLIIIFKNLDLSNETKRHTPKFNYNIVYFIGEYKIYVSVNEGNYTVLVNEEKQTLGSIKQIV
jgi:recombinational DNA repair ATPase RecF